jgi:hypothetical protein
VYPTDRSGAPAGPAPLSTWTKAAYFVAGNVLPALGILSASSSMGLPRWQSNEFHEFVAFLIVGPAAAVFCLFLFYSIACFTLALFRPGIAAEHFAVRLGLYTGIILGLHYCLLFGTQLLNIQDARSSEGVLKIVVLMLACIVIALAGWGLWSLGIALRPLVEKLFKSRACVALAMMTPLAALAVGFALPADQATSVGLILLLGPAVLAIGLTPCWYLAATIAMAVHIARVRAARFQFHIWQLFAWTSWLAAYLAAWRFAVNAALEAYAALPVDPPSSNCYVATAAACGHARFVGSREVLGASGKVFWANRQLAYLKCGEIVLQTTWPELHKQLRQVYDYVGPPLARRLSNPWLADAAYLVLKPMEWATRIALQILAPGSIRSAQKLYSSRAGERQLPEQ